MRSMMILASAIALAGGLSAASTAQAVSTAQSKSCSARADQEGLKGADRARFRAVCLKGLHSPQHPTSPTHSLSADAVVAPSGSDRTARNKQCSAEASRRGLHDALLQDFQKACLASAAPASAIGSNTRKPAPTKAIPGIDKVTDAPPH